VAGKETTALDDSETQRLINAALGMDRDVFHATVLFGQADMWNFADAKDKERIDILTKILGLSEIDEWLELAKAARDKNAEKVSAVATQTIRAQAELDAVDLDSIQSRVDSWLFSHEAELLALQAQIERLIVDPSAIEHNTQQIEELLAEKVVLQEQLAAAVVPVTQTDAIPGMIETKAKQVNARLALDIAMTADPKPMGEIPGMMQLQADRDQWANVVNTFAMPVATPNQDLLNSDAQEQAALTIAQNSINSVQTEINGFAALGTGDCSRCGQPITAEHVANEVAELQAKMPQYAQEMQRINERRATIGNDLESRRERDQVARIAAESDRAEKVRQLAALDEEIQTLNSKAAQAQEAERRAISGNIAKAQEDFNAVGAEIQALVDDDAKKRQEEQLLVAQERRATVQAISDTDAKLSASQSVLSELNGIAAERDRCFGQVATLNAKLNPFLAELETATNKEAELKSVVDQYDASVAKLDDAAKYFEFWVTAFGPKGLKSHIIDAKRDEMTTAANHWIGLLTGGTTWVQIDTQTMGRTTKTLANKLNIRVFTWNPDGTITERGYRSWSGGEKQRVSLGVDLGLSNLVAARAKKSYGLLIFDEVFKHLDSAGREAVVEMLNLLKRERESVLVIDHDAEFQGNF
jgi:DNA repair exonuclease SbcCD ATPase subunit